MFAYGIAVTLQSQTSTTTDAYGNDKPVFTPITTTGAFAPAGSTEQVQGRDTVIENDTVYLTDLPAGTVVKPTDEIQIGSKLYQVLASPNNWASPFTGWSPGVVVELQYVSG